MPKQKSTNKRRPTRARLQRREEQSTAQNAGETSTRATSSTNRAEPSTDPDRNVSYADLSTEVLHLLLAQRNLALSGSRDTLLRRLADHDRAEAVAVPPPIPALSPTTPQFSQESLRSLASDLAPLLRDVLVPSSSPSSTSQASSGVGFPAPTASTPPLDFGNPAHVATLISSPPSSSSPITSLADAASLPKKLEDQILSGEFVDFSSLLPGNSDRPSFGPIRLSVEGDQGFTIPIQPTFSNFSKRPKIDSVDKWLTAFGIYASIVVAKFPHKASQLFAYQRIIREATQKFKGLAWYAYDIDFRKLAAKNPALNWGERHLQLWLDKFTGLARSICFVCGAADHMSDICPLSSPRSEGSRPRFSNQRGLCRNFNGGLPCASTPCPFEHRCSRTDCGARHGAYVHEDTSSKRTDGTSHRRKHK